MEIVRTLRAMSFCLALGLLTACGSTPDDSGGSGGTVGGGGSGGTGGSGGVGGAAGGSGCESKDDCTAEAPLCTADGRCVACLGHADCPRDLPSCADDGVCMLCGDESSCVGRGTCDPVSGGCVDCVEDGDCGEGRCTAANRCVECIEGADCPSGVCTANVCLKGNPCNDSLPCEVGMVCVTWAQGALYGTCEVLCDLEAQTGCEDGKLCELATFDRQTSEPIGFCAAPNGGPTEGQPCGDASPKCEANLLCINYGDVEDECVRFCDPEVEDACGEDRLCEAVRFSEVPNTPSVHVCTKVRPTCESDRDCDEGEVCAVVGGPNDTPELQCIRSRGPKGGGAECSQDSQCATGWCVKEIGLCYGTCETGPDCVDGASCTDIWVNVNGGDSIMVPVCMKSCGTDADCKATEGCTAFISHARDEMVAVCNRSDGTKSVGESCSSWLDCRSHTCLGGGAAGAGVCVGPCRQDADCGSTRLECLETFRQQPGPDGSWYTADDVYLAIGMCGGHLCEADDGCDGWACVPQSDGNHPRVGEMALRCSPPVGTLRGGARCDTGNWSADCRSGNCEFADGSYRCFEACSVPADCADGMACQEAAMSFYHGYTGTEFVYEDFAACVPASPGQ